jgi:uncharacterized protein YodC (DUF2158 family)
MNSNPKETRQERAARIREEDAQRQRESDERQQRWVEHARMLEERFPVSSCVQLRSGGPIMTVVEVTLSSHDIRCTWFDRMKLSEAEFDDRLLKRVPEPT